MIGPFMLRRLGIASQAEVVLQFHRRGDGLRERVVERSDDEWVGLMRPRWALSRQLHALGRKGEIAGRHNHHDDDESGIEGSETSESE